MVDLRSVLLRAPKPTELEQAFAVLAARDTADLGAPDFTLEDLREQWQADGFDLATDARVLLDGGRQVVAYAHIDHHGAMVAIAPQHEGEGIGPQVLDWVEGRERELGRAHHVQPVAAANTRAATFLAGRGYQLVRSYYRMVRPLTPEDRAPDALPPGLALRPLERRRDAAALHAIDEAAFHGHSDYKPETLAAFRRRHLDAHDFDADASLVACRDEQIVGFLLARRWADEQAGFVDVLGVHPDQHGRGTGTALLRAAFAIWAAAGLREVFLGVSSQNPVALRLYRRLGMEIRFQVDIWQRDARSATAARGTS